MKKRFAVMLMSLAAVGLASCLEELEKTDKISGSSFQPIVEFPLVNSDFTMEEFLTEGESKARISDQGGVMVLTYDDSLSTPPGDLFFFLPDQQSPTLAITGPDVTFPSPGGSVTVTKNLTFAFNTTQAELLDSILMKEGELRFQVNSNMPANINLTMSVPSLRLQGGVMQQVVTLNGPGNSNSILDLRGSVMDLTGNGSATNTVSFSITATITDTGQPVNSTHSINCSFELIDLRFRALFGNLGTQSISLRADSINTDIFDNAFSGSVELLSPAISLTLRNSFGIPLGFDIQSINAIKNNTNIQLAGPAVDPPLNPYRLNAPSMSQVGQSVSSEINLNASNSNLPQLISSLPNYLAYQFDLALNPAPVASKNFVLDDSRLSIGVHLELPFHGRVQQLTMSKRFDFNGLGIDNVEDTRVVVKTVNESPLDAAMQVYFVDAVGTVIDSLFTSRSILKGAPVDAAGFTTGSADVTTTVIITQDKVNRIEQAESLVVTAIIFTTNNGADPVKFAVEDKLKFNIGVSTRIGYDLK